MRSLLYFLTHTTFHQSCQNADRWMEERMLWLKTSMSGSVYDPLSLIRTQNHLLTNCIKSLFSKIDQIKNLIRSGLEFHINYVQKVHFIPYFMHFFKEFLKDRAAQFALTEAVSVLPYHIMLILMCNLVLKQILFEVLSFPTRVD